MSAPTAEEMVARRAAREEAQAAREASRTQWISDNPDAYAAEQAALAANRAAIQAAQE